MNVKICIDVGLCMLRFVYVLIYICIDLLKERFDGCLDLHILIQFHHIYIYIPKHTLTLLSYCAEPFTRFMLSLNIDIPNLHLINILLIIFFKSNNFQQFVNFSIPDSPTRNTEPSLGVICVTVDYGR